MSYIIMYDVMTCRNLSYSKSTFRDYLFNFFVSSTSFCHVMAGL